MHRQKTFALDTKEVEDVLSILLEKSGLFKGLGEAEKKQLIEQTRKQLSEQGVELNRDNIKDRNLQSRLVVALVATHVMQQNPNFKFNFDILLQKLSPEFKNTDANDKLKLEAEIKKLYAAFSKLPKQSTKSSYLEQPKDDVKQESSNETPSPDETEVAGIFDDAGNLLVNLGFLQGASKGKLTVGELLMMNSGGDAAEQEERSLHIGITEDFDSHGLTSTAPRPTPLSH